MLLTSELVCISVHGFTLNLDGIIHGCRVVFSHSLLIVDWYVWNLNNQMVIPVLYDYVNLHWLYSCNSRMFEFIHRYRPEFSLGYRRLSWYCVCSTESFALQSPNPAWCPQHRSTIHRNYTSMKCNSWPLLSHALSLHYHQHHRKFSNITFAWYYQGRTFKIFVGGCFSFWDRLLCSYLINVRMCTPLHSLFLQVPKPTQLKIQMQYSTLFCEKLSILYYMYSKEHFNLFIIYGFL